MSAASITPTTMAHSESQGFAGSAKAAAGQAAPWSYHSLAAWMAPLKALLEGVEARIARREAAERESAVSRYIAAHGGHFTDEMERDISRRFGHIVGH